MLNHLRNRFRTAEKTKREFNALPNVNRVSVYTVRRRLRAAGLTCRQPAKKIKICPVNMIRRLQWANSEVVCIHAPTTETCFCGKRRKHNFTSFVTLGFDPYAL